VDEGRGTAPDPDASGCAAPVGYHRFFRIGQFLDDSPRVGEKLDAGRGRLRAPPDALDQTDAQPPFQKLYLQADGRLCECGLFGGGGKASELGNMNEGLKLVEVHQRNPYGMNKDHKLL
jgi:hypothetical protein